MASPLSELAEIAAIFRAQPISYALIGGWAVNVWGFLRASDDFDFLAELSPSRRKQLIAALPEDWKAGWIAPGSDDPIAGLLRIAPKEVMGRWGMTPSGRVAALTDNLLMRAERPRLPAVLDGILTAWAVSLS